jgi:hypothetical protein
MDYAEWIFEKPDEEGVAVAYEIEEMKQLFPEVTFEESLSDNVATLKISNAQTGLSEYMLYAYGGLTAKSCAGSAEMNVIASHGAVVSGTIKSFGSESDDITIKLYAEGSETASYTATVKGNSTSFIIENVKLGSYTVVVQKKGHVKQQFTLTLTDKGETLDVTLLPEGDLNADGCVDISDVTVLLSQLAGNNVIAEDVDQDLNKDGGVDISDITALLNVLAGTGSF